MMSEWPTEVRREYAGSDVRFLFPVRPLGWARLGGLFLAAFGLAVAWKPVRGLLRVAEQLLSGISGQAEWTSALFQLPFALAGAVPLLLGLHLLFGRCRVEWRDGTLRSTELLGPLAWTRRLARKPIRNLRVIAAPTRQSSGAGDALGAVFVLCEDAAHRIVILGYPQKWLLPLAEELSIHAGGSVSSTELPRVAIDERQDPVSVVEVVVQPTTSTVQVEEGRSRLRLDVPPAGVWRGSRGLFVFGLVWCTVVGVLTAFVEWPDEAAWMVAFFLLVFWGVGIGTLVAGVNMGLRSAVLVVVGGQLEVEMKGLFRVRRHEWRQAEVAAIRSGPSGLRVNDEAVLELQIHPHAGSKVGLLGGRDEQELAWMATRLRRALGVPAR